MNLFKNGRNHNKDRQCIEDLKIYIKRQYNYTQLNESSLHFFQESQSIVFIYKNKFPKLKTYKYNDYNKDRQF